MSVSLESHSMSVAHESHAMSVVLESHAMAVVLKSLAVTFFLKWGLSCRVDTYLELRASVSFLLKRHLAFVYSLLTIFESAVHCTCHYFVSSFWLAS